MAVIATAAIAGFGVGSGEGVLLQLQPRESPRVVGRLDCGVSGASTHPTPHGAIERVEPAAPLRPQ